MTSDNAKKDWWRKADIQLVAFSPDWQPTLAFLKKNAHQIEDEYPRELRWHAERSLFSYIAPAGLHFDGILLFCRFTQNLKDTPVIIIETQQGAEELKCSVSDTVNLEYFFPHKREGSGFLLEVINLPADASFGVAFIIDRPLTEVPQLNTTNHTDRFSIYSSTLSVCVVHLMSFRVLLEYKRLLFGDEKLIEKSAEIGCGSGILSSIISSFSMQHIALDLHNSAVVYVGYPVFDRLLSRFLGVKVDRHEHFEYIKHDAKTVNFEREGFDLIASQSCFEHIQEPKDAFLRIADGLKPGGQAIIAIDHNYSLTDLHYPDPSNEKRAWWHLRCTPEQITEAYTTFCSPELAASRIAFYETCNMLTYRDYLNIANEINARFPNIHSGIIPLWVTDPYHWLARDLLRQRLENTFINRDHYGVEDLLNEIFLFYLEKEPVVESNVKSALCPKCGQSISGREIMAICKSCNTELACLPKGEIKAKPPNISAIFVEFEDFKKIPASSRNGQELLFDVVLFLETSFESTYLHSFNELIQRLQEIEGFRVLVVENALNMELVLPVVSKGRAILKFLWITPKLFNRLNIEKSLFYIRYYGFRLFLQKVSGKITKLSRLSCKDKETNSWK